MNEDLFRKVSNSVSEGVYRLDAERRIVFWNRAAERITGYTEPEALGKRCMDDMLRHVDGSGCELCTGGCPVSAAMADRRPREAEVFLHHKDGHRVQVAVKVIPLFDESAASGAIEIFADRSDRSKLLAELESLRKESLVDPLTGLGNRRYADTSVDSALRELEAEGRGFGVLMIDIDRFKNINDNYGHPVGDRVLRMIGWTLANAIRRLDTAARWGGEEFLVVAPGADVGTLAEIAERARLLVDRSWISVDGGRRVAATVSIGGAVARPGESADALVARADMRLYDCKRAGRDRVEVGD
jgi:diguanylate cyclase (GGDEF)-like protein/PAS domain S-box-containing protein